MTRETERSFDAMRTQATDNLFEWTVRNLVVLSNVIDGIGRDLDPEFAIKMLCSAGAPSPYPLRVFYDYRMHRRRTERP